VNLPIVRHFITDKMKVALHPSFGCIRLHTTPLCALVSMLNYDQPSCNISGYTSKLLSRYLVEFTPRSMAYINARNIELHFYFFFHCRSYFRTPCRQSIAAEQWILGNSAFFGKIRLLWE
jgi:hypothetical protein